jgi:hypothetical protein
MANGFFTPQAWSAEALGIRTRRKVIVCYKVLQTVAIASRRCIAATTLLKQQRISELSTA